eukprot:725-Heterococcus_DN1.PRE.1
MMIACIRMRSQLTGLLQMCVHKMLRAAPPRECSYAKWNLWFLADCVLRAVKQPLLDALARQCVCCAQHPLRAAATSCISLVDC